MGEEIKEAAEGIVAAGRILRRGHVRRLIRQYRLIRQARSRLRLHFLRVRILLGRHFRQDLLAAAEVRRVQPAQWAHRDFREYQAQPAQLVQWGPG